MIIGILAKNDTAKCIGAEELKLLLTGLDERSERELYTAAAETAKKAYGNRVFARGLIEFTNYCVNDCLYCGLRRSNRRVGRYRLTADEILERCAEGYSKGFRTFVLQGGDDRFYDDRDIINIIKSIKNKYPDCALTLSIGERGRDTYKSFFVAGADRYLLRHETADPGHYAALHPAGMRLESRMQALSDLKEIGFQTGAGFMVGSPYQTVDNIVGDLLFLRDFKPHMVGIGPFLPKSGTPFGVFPGGSVRLTLICVALTRLLIPNALIPATTALASADGEGRKMGILAGANVVMPNLTPPGQREKYAIYDNKAITGGESSENINRLAEELRSIGYELDFSRGDWKDRGAPPHTPLGASPHGLIFYE